MITAADCHAAWRQFPTGGLDAIIGTGTCLILAPHPDDESLGCGGLIAACVQAGRPPLVAVLTDGTGSHPNSREFPPERLRAVRQQETRAAVAHLGLTPDRLIFLNQPDTAAPLNGPDFDQALAILLNAIRGERDCQTILASWRHDPHCDHEAASVLASATAQAARIRHVAYPVWGWTLPPLTPVETTAATGYRLDISRFRAMKQAAIQAHRSQYGDLITDDPDGFRLPPELLSVFDNRFETFLLP